jgi:hypothetical protein
MLGGGPGRGSAKQRSGSTSGGSRGAGGAWVEGDEWHNLFFEGAGSSGRQRAAAGRGGRGRTAGGWAEYEYFDTSDEEGDVGGSDGASDSEAAGWGATGRGGRQWEREDWRWWDDEDERCGLEGGWWVMAHAICVGEGRQGLTAVLSGPPFRALAALRSVDQSRTACSLSTPAFNSNLSNAPHFGPPCPWPQALV